MFLAWELFTKCRYQLPDMKTSTASFILKLKNIGVLYRYENKSEIVAWKELWKHKNHCD